MKGSRKSCGKKSKPLKSGTGKNIACLSLDRNFGDAALGLGILQPQYHQEPGNGDRREDRGQDADRQGHGESANWPRSQPEHYDRGGERRELAVEDRNK